MQVAPPRPPGGPAMNPADGSAEPGRRHARAVITGICALVAATVIAIVFTQSLRSEGTVISETTDKALDGKIEAERRLVRICFRVTRTDTFTVELLDKFKQPVRVLAESERLEGARRHCFRWDGTGDDGDPQPGGRYRLQVSLADAGRTALAGERIRLGRKTADG